MRVELMQGRSNDRRWGIALLLAVPLLGLVIAQDVTSHVDWLISDQWVLRGDAAFGWWSELLKAVSLIGDFVPRLIISFAVALWLYRGERVVAAISFLLLPFLAGAYSSLFKLLFDRPRPQLIAHLDHVSSASYPSGHMTGAVLLYAMLVMVTPKRWRRLVLVCALMMMALTGLSRISLGVHWATDIVGGACVGLGFALLARPYLVAAEA